MHESAALDGDIVDSEVIAIDARSPAALYGKGVFTTLAIKSGQPFLWEKHWRRLNRDANCLSIDASSILEESVRSDLARLLKRNSVDEGRARITLLDASPNPLWPYRSNSQIRVLIVTGDPHQDASFYRLGISPYLINSTSPLAGIKSCNYLENLIALDDARAGGFDEAIRVNERGEVASACMGNIFWLKDGKLSTPPLSAGCLPGTTREFVMENLPCREDAASIKDLLAADFVFLTSAGVGIASVVEIEGTKFQISDHQISRLIPAPAGQKTVPQ